MAIYSGCSHEKWWFSIVMGQFTRGYYLDLCLTNSTYFYVQLQISWVGILMDPESSSFFLHRATLPSAVHLAASSESAPAASARAEAPGNGPRSATARPVAGSGSGWIWSKKILGMSVKIWQKMWIWKNLKIQEWNRWCERKGSVSWVVNHGVMTVPDNVHGFRS